MFRDGEGADGEPESEVGSSRPPRRGRSSGVGLETGNDGETDGPVEGKVRGSGEPRHKLAVHGTSGTGSVGREEGSGSIKDVGIRERYIANE